jgi:hypothetical protein
MPGTLRDQFGFWLERFAVLRPLRPLLLKYDGEAPAGRAYVNRLNGHVVVITEDGELR